MPVLVGLLTYLALSGTPGKPETFTAKGEDTGTKGGATGITGLTLGGTPGRNYGTFDAKATATADSRAVTDRYIARLQFGDVSEVSASLTDRYVAVLQLSGLAGLGKLASDTYRPVLTFGYGALDKSGVRPYAVTDSYVPVLTFDLPIASEQFARTDSYVPVLTLAVTLSPSDALELTDSYVPVLTLTPYLQAVAANVARPVLDTYVVALTFTPTLLPAGEVDDIRITERPYYLIRIEEI